MDMHEETFDSMWRAMKQAQDLAGEKLVFLISADEPGQIDCHTVKGDYKGSIFETDTAKQ